MIYIFTIYQSCGVRRETGDPAGTRDTSHRVFERDRALVEACLRKNPRVRRDLKATTAVQRGGEVGTGRACTVRN